MEKYESKKSRWLYFAMDILVMYAVTALLLFILALIMYKTSLSVSAARGIMVGIYILCGILGGFLIGKKMKEKKFLWGLGVGTTYFVILLIMSLIVKGGVIDDSVQLLVKGILCIASSMVGGMVS